MTDTGRKPNENYCYFHHPKDYSAGMNVESDSDSDVDDAKQEG